MNYKDVLLEHNFHYSDVYGLWIKSKGFGQSASVERFMKGLFIMKRNSRSHLTDGEIFFDGFPENFNEFKELIKKL